MSTAKQQWKTNLSTALGSSGATSGAETVKRDITKSVERKVMKDVSWQYNSGASVVDCNSTTHKYANPTGQHDSKICKQIECYMIRAQSCSRRKCLFATDKYRTPTLRGP